ncbi:hypothetical protein BX661DRAFT_189116 [Kickxella alabastrina]|uniref:uncharacterized protein n=1 Tax=Kickxella alabastrina TaxID=61397 RepID=UPI00221F3B4B|nr:uncharacterized protein BX661DRAFT_189116 [Kickxella alabastrina]KAI7820471.1 hypothetical protein BX661DRAFT_189116 [Kickxella alabastrina]
MDYTQTTIATPPLPPSSLTPAMDDPLSQLSIVLSSEHDAVEQVCKLYTESSDIRGSLRLFDTAYLDVLSFLHAQSTNKGSHETSSILSSQKGLLQKLSEIAMQEEAPMTVEAEAAAAWVLADCVDQLSDSEGICTRLGRIVGQVLATRVGESKETEALRQLLRATGMREGPWLDSLLAVVCGAIVELADNAIQGQALRSSQLLCLLAQLLEDYSAYALRVMSSVDSLRRMARHVIKLLSDPHPAVSAPALHVLARLLLTPVVSGRPAALSILGDSLRGKLFDEAHLARTVLLVSDLCQNCNGSDKQEDFLVLEAASGIIACVAQSQGAADRRRFFEMTEMARALDHLVGVARIDRRYIHPLVSIINHVVREGGSSPLVVAMCTDRSDDFAGSIVAEVFDIVGSGIEDIPYTQPHFGLAESAGGQQKTWPRVSSDESGGGWLVQSTVRQRQGVIEFLANALRLSCEAQGSGSGNVRELMQAIAQVLESRSIGFRRTQGEEDVATIKNLLGMHYWTVRPVLELAIELARVSPQFEAFWVPWLNEADAGKWAAEVCRTVTECPQEILSQAIHRDIMNASVSDDISVAANSKLSIPAAVVVPNVATPAASTHSSSGTASPQPPATTLVPMVIGIDAMRAANLPEPVADVDEFPDNTADVLQSVVLKQWLRISEAEIAARVVSLDPMAPNVYSVVDQARRSLLGGLDALQLGIAATQALRHRHAVAAHQLQSDYTALLLSEQEAREETEEEITELQQKMASASYLQEQAKQELMELSARLQNTESDASEWKRECVETRGLLETAEEKAREVAALRENVGGLERALGDAVARLHILEMQALAERAVGEELRGKNAAMAAHLAEYVKVTESMNNLSRLQHN